MSWFHEIQNFLEDYSSTYVEDPHVDINNELGITGDDFHELMENFAKEYQVDMRTYRWYFHSEDEGFGNIGAIFFKPPFRRVQHIPVTPQVLADSIEARRWVINYPPHHIPKRRWDLVINTVVFIATILVLIWITLWRVL